MKNKMKDRLIFEEKAVALEYHAGVLKQMSHYIIDGIDNYENVISDIFELVHRINDIIKEMAFLNTK